MAGQSQLSEVLRSLIEAVPRRTAPRTAACKLQLRWFMRRQLQSMLTGIAVMALGGMIAAGCGGRDLRSARTDGGASDAAASSGGQARSTLSQGGSGVTTGAGGSTGGVGTAASGGAPGDSSASVDATVGVSTPDGGGTVDRATDAAVKEALAPETQTAPDSSVAVDVTEVCGPACEVPCPTYGYTRDEYGCPTCTCSPQPLACSVMKCQSCAWGYVRDPNQCLTCTCAPDPSVPCSQLLDSGLCNASPNCRWLDPGFCPPDPPAEARCYDREAVGCNTDRDCSDGLTCQERITKPYDDSGIMCGIALNICL